MLTKRLRHQCHGRLAIGGSQAGLIVDLNNAMSRTSLTLLSAMPSVLDFTSAKLPAAGWHGHTKGWHTFAITVHNFQGRIALQGSQMLAPPKRTGSPCPARRLMIFCPLSSTRGHWRRAIRIRAMAKPRRSDFHCVSTAFGCVL